MSWQAPRTQEARHRGVLRKGLRWAGYLSAVGMVLAASWAFAADAPAAAKPTPVQGPVLVPPVGMTGA
ncbi:MAG TPA: type IV secretion system protein VirJ, partial [Ralstonia sp.]|nr:type IV secretion system protein VirJ [Ralstonia sp.]